MICPCCAPPTIPAAPKFYCFVLGRSLPTFPLIFPHETTGGTQVERKISGVSVAKLHVSRVQYFVELQGGRTAASCAVFRYVSSPLCALFRTSTSFVCISQWSVGCAGCVEGDGILMHAWYITRVSMSWFHGTRPLIGK